MTRAVRPKEWAREPWYQSSSGAPPHWRSRCPWLPHTPAEQVVSRGPLSLPRHARGVSTKPRRTKIFELVAGRTGIFVDAMGQSL